MGKFRMRPVVVEAVQWFRGVEIDGVVGDWDNNPMMQDQYSVCTPGGWVYVSPGDWIITNAKGEKYPCKPDTFEATYEPVED